MTQRNGHVTHLTCKMPDQTHPLNALDAEIREAAIGNAMAGSAPMPRDPVRTRILQTAGGPVAVLAALQYVYTMRRGRRV